jgi:hypothetical protein
MPRDRRERPGFAAQKATRSMMGCVEEEDEEEENEERDGGGGW